MYRPPNTNRHGGSFDPMTIQQVWNKAATISGYDPAVIRKDCCGATIRRSSYGLTIKEGWEIDHINPVSNQGSDDLFNLQPLQWQNNRQKSDLVGNWFCAVCA
ncbi:MAG: HNH endonuclease [Armatimonadetes bacterium]|nr:HNH endonuclease [Armatimonadota bacterium]